jgi:hypothetical protein
LRASDHQKALDPCVVGSVDDNTRTQMALGFLRSFPHQVAHVGLIALDFTRASHLKTLLGAGMGLHFRHNSSYFLKTERKDRPFQEILHATEKYCLTAGHTDAAG